MSTARRSLVPLALLLLAIVVSAAATNESSSSTSLECRSDIEYTTLSCGLAGQIDLVVYGYEVISIATNNAHEPATLVRKVDAVAPSFFGVTHYRVWQCLDADEPQPTDISLKLASPLDHTDVELAVIRVPPCTTTLQLQPSREQSEAGDMVLVRPRDAAVVQRIGTHDSSSEIAIVGTKLGGQHQAADYSRWMELMGSQSNDTGALGSLPLVQVVLPGSHDSGTFNLTLKSAQPPDAFVGVVAEACRLLRLFGVKINCTDLEMVAELISFPWAVTQTNNWERQLSEDGVRSFDYRAYYDKQIDGGTWVIEHSLAGGIHTSVANATAEIVSWLDQHPGELIVFEYKVFSGGNETDLVQQLLAGLQPYGYHWTDGVTIPGNPTISQMIAAQQRAIIVLANGNQGAGNVTQGISNDWPNSCNNSFIHNYDKAAIGKFAVEQPDAMRKFAWQATAGIECIVLGVLGVLANDNGECQRAFGFNCTATLLGLINQLNAEFSFQWVLDAYAAVSPLSSAVYFGNIWNFDNLDTDLTDIARLLNAITLANLHRPADTAGAIQPPSISPAKVLRHAAAAAALERPLHV